MANFFKGLGDAICEGSKVVTGALEEGVKMSGLGDVAESAGIHVDENIHKNGLNATAKGPIAKIATLGTADHIQGCAKFKSAGGDFGGFGSAAAKDRDVTIAAANAGMDGRGAYADAAFGAMINSDYTQIETGTDFTDVVTQLLKKLMSSSYADIPKKVLELMNIDFIEFVHKVLDEFLQLTFGGGVDLFLMMAKRHGANIYLDVGAAASVGVGGKLKFGMDTDVSIMGKKQTFKMYEFGGELTFVEGLAAGVGYSKKGQKTFDRKDEGVHLVASVSATGFTVSIGLIITADVGCEVIDVIKKTLEFDI